MSIPEWAYKRAAALYVENRIEGLSAAGVYRSALAAYIAAHEQPPIDPVQLALSEVFDGCGARALARFHTELVKHGLQITPVQRKEI